VEKTASKQFKVDVFLLRMEKKATNMINETPYELDRAGSFSAKKIRLRSLKDMRKKSAYPPVVDSIRMNAVEDKVKGLKLGADDYWRSH